MHNFGQPAILFGWINLPVHKHGNLQVTAKKSNFLLFYILMQKENQPLHSSKFTRVHKNVIDFMHIDNYEESIASDMISSRIFLSYALKHHKMSKVLALQGIQNTKIYPS